MISENHRLIDGEQRIEISVRQSMWMFTCRLKRHQVDHVDDANLEIGKVLPQQIDRRQSFQRRHITGARHDHIRFEFWSLLAQSHMPMPLVQ